MTNLVVAKRPIRCSSLPMLLACAPSSSPSFDEHALEIETANPAAALGTAAHEAMALLVAGLEPDLMAIALRNGVELDELRPLVAFGRQAWTTLAPSFPNPRAEVEVGGIDFGHHGFSLIGHVDVLSAVSADEARGCDWKSGRKEESDYYAQVAGYAACLILRDGYQHVVFPVVWLRSGTIETYTFTRDDAQAFMARISVALDRQTYRTGEHCAHCRRSHECPALVAQSRRDLAIFAVADAGELVATAPPEQVVSLRRRIRALTTFADSLDGAIRRRVATDGPLDSGDGYQLALVEENGRREIDTLAAWSVLQARLTDEELAPCITISARGIDDAVAKKAGKGQGAAAKRELAHALDNVEAVTRPTVTKLKEVRLPRALDAKKETAA